MYKRILLKLSGESLNGEKNRSDSCIDSIFIERISYEIKELHDLCYEICIVIGGGNICRGTTISSIGIERANADYMGMLATVINSLAVQGKLESIGVPTRVQSSISMPTIAETFIRKKAISHIEKGRVVIFAGGTGNPFFTTDTAAVLRAVETKCDVVLKGTQVDGVYSDDPNKITGAKHHIKIDYDTVLQQNLKVMDAAAISLARENNLPIVVFSIQQKGSLRQTIEGKGRYSIINCMNKQHIT